MTVAITDDVRLGDVFGKATAAYARRFVPFVALAAIAHIPLYLAQFMLPTLLGNTFGRGLILLLLRVICAAISSGAVIYGVVQELRGREFSFAGSLGIMLARLLPMTGVAVCAGFLTAIATIAFVVPGYMVACAYYVSIPACIAEHGDVFASMDRSATLTRGYRWPIFGTILLITVASFVTGFVVARAMAPTGAVGVAVAVNAAILILSAFNAVLVGVFYYQLRVAKEGVDIDRIAGVFD
jgi:hypothetical protein